MIFVQFVLERERNCLSRRLHGYKSCLLVRNLVIPSWRQNNTRNIYLCITVIFTYCKEFARWMSSSSKLVAEAAVAEGEVNCCADRVAETCQATPLQTRQRYVQLSRYAIDVSILIPVQIATILLPEIWIFLTCSFVRWRLFAILPNCGGSIWDIFL